MIWIECLKAILYGIVEGITEWLPISSTGHLILFQNRLPFAFSQDALFLKEFWELFEVMIQLGAVFAVVILFWRRLTPLGFCRDVVKKTPVLRLWGRVLIACLPAALIGIFSDALLVRFTERDLDGWLYNSRVVAAMLILYGVAFLVVERMRFRKTPSLCAAEAISPRIALGIGAFQALSIIPGTSRSGATILGAMLLGLSRGAGAEFSFFLAIPTMVGASGVKLLGFWSWVSEQEVTVPGMAWLVLALGCLTSFAVSMVAIRFLLDFVKRHSFASFGVYRIILGALVLFLGFFGF